MRVLPLSLAQGSELLFELHSEIKHELLPLSMARVTFFSVAATSASSAVAVVTAAAACIAQSLCHPLRPTRSPAAALVAELSLPTLSSHLLPLAPLPSNLNSLSQFFL
ncbi:uncharacterized protein DS421_20g700570 [Arachis hypogaea]|nr:uncharacterized protein DS421_20g700570 [Arachis hypogaea]